MASSHRVLLIEDDEGLRYAMRVALERAGLEVDVAVDGREGVKAIDTSPDAWCCVILDMLLPSIHGSSIVAHIARTATARGRARSAPRTVARPPCSRTLRRR